MMRNSHEYFLLRQYIRINEILSGYVSLPYLCTVSSCNCSTNHGFLFFTYVALYSQHSRDTRFQMFFIKMAWGYVP